jgi:hypothetical protein
MRGTISRLGRRDCHERNELKGRWGVWRVWRYPWKHRRRDRFLGLVVAFRCRHRVRRACLADCRGLRLEDPSEGPLMRLVFAEIAQPSMSLRFAGLNEGYRKERCEVAKLRCEGWVRKKEWWSRQPTQHVK